MNDDEGRCSDCGASVSPDDTLCSNCGLNLVTGEKYEEKYARAQDTEPPPENAKRVSGAGLAVGFALVIFAGFMYQRDVMEVFRAKPDESREYVRMAREVQYLVRQCRMADTDVERENYCRRARSIGEDLKESLVVKESNEENNSNGSDAESSEISGMWNTFRHNLRSKVKYHLSRLPER